MSYKTTHDTGRFMGPLKPIMGPDMPLDRLPENFPPQGQRQPTLDNSYRADELARSDFRTTHCLHV